MGSMGLDLVPAEGGAATDVERRGGGRGTGRGRGRGGGGRGGERGGGGRAGGRTGQSAQARGMRNVPGLLGRLGHIQEASSAVLGTSRAALEPYVALLRPP